MQPMTNAPRHVHQASSVRICMTHAGIVLRCVPFEFLSAPGRVFVFILASWCCADAQAKRIQYPVISKSEQALHTKAFRGRNKRL